jgi:peroxiredoxin Q/BCP
MAKVEVGDRAPDFELPGTGGRSYRLADYLGKGVILAFYPGDFTRVCTAQLCSYRDNAERLDGLGIEVLGISPQSVESHERFTDKHSLNVPLLADEDRAVAGAYGVAAGPLVRRSIFVVDSEGVIRYKHVAMVGLGFQDIDDLERAVGTLKARSAAQAADRQG